MVALRATSCEVLLSIGQDGACDVVSVNLPNNRYDGGGVVHDVHAGVRQEAADELSVRRDAACASVSPFPVFRHGQVYGLAGREDDRLLVTRWAYRAGHHSVVAYSVAVIILVVKGRGVVVLLGVPKYNYAFIG